MGADNNKITPKRQKNGDFSSRRSFISMAIVYPVIHFSLNALDNNFILPMFGVFVFPIMFLSGFLLVTRVDWFKKNILNVRFILFFIQMFYLAYVLYLNNVSRDFTFTYWVYLLLTANVLMSKQKLAIYLAINFIVISIVVFVVGDTPEVPALVSLLWNVVLFFFVYVTMRSKISREELILKSEQQLQDQQQEMDELLNSLSAMIYYKDMNNRIIRVNDAMADFLGKPASFFRNVSLYDVVPKARAHSYHEEDLEIIRTGEAIQNVVEEVATPLGEQRWIRSDKKPYYDSDGKIKGVVIFSLDITEEIEGDLALRQREELFKRVFNEAPYGVMIMDLGKKIIHTNKTLCQQLGYDADELNAFSMFDFVPTEQRKSVELLYSELSPSQHSITRELQLLKKQGGAINVNFFATQIKDENDVPLLYLGMIENITEKRKAEAQLEQYSKDLEKSNKDLQQFAYIISHDLKEPLRMMTSYIQLLKRRYNNKLDDTGREFMGFVVDSAKRMNNLIDDLLSYSRVGRDKRSKEMVSTNTLIKNAQNNLRLLIQENNATINIKGVMPIVLCNKHQITNLFQNLIGNAIKYHREGIDPIIEIDVENRKDHWLFSVKDNGIGIEQEHLESIFMIFNRIHSNETYEGTGIGLAIAKRIVETHGGKIWVHSVIDGGSTFFFTLPIK